MDIVTDISIARNMQTAWNVLSDVTAWSHWNPTITNVEVAAFEAGGAVTFDLRLAAGPLGTSRIHCDMVWVRRGEGFAWTGPRNGVLRRLLSGEHWFLLEETGPDSCVFHHGETFSGALRGGLSAVAEDRIWNLYGGFNKAFKNAVESL